jgi:ribose 5-phosphate isomerase B
MIIGLAADHAGKELKEALLDLVKALGHEVVDYGVAVSNEQSVDYPDYAALLAHDIETGKVEAGVAVCGSGIGMSIVANKFPGVRAALVWDEFSARMSRAHNDANMICLGARVLTVHRAADLLKIWLETGFEGGRHKMRRDKIREIEKKNFKLRVGE